MLVSAKLCHAGVAGLCALLTLAAGMPRVDCLCPNGNVKAYCLNTILGRGGCCCRGACCDQVSAHKKSCCQHHGSASRPHAGQCPCRTTLTPATSFLVVASAPPESAAGATATIDYPPVPVAAGSLRPVVADLLSGPLPPTDLLATCKHLLI